MRISDAGRAVFVTQAARAEAPAYRGPYAAAQTALQTLVRVWAREVAITPIKVNLFDPGPTRTRLRATVMPGEDPLNLPIPAEIAEQIVPLCLPAFGSTGRLFDFRERALSEAV